MTRHDGFDVADEHTHGVRAARLVRPIHTLSAACARACQLPSTPPPASHRTANSKTNPPFVDLEGLGGSG